MGYRQAKYGRRVTSRIAMTQATFGFFFHQKNVSLGDDA
jgi:hypothetical protein